MISKILSTNKSYLKNTISQNIWLSALSCMLMIFVLALPTILITPELDFTRNEAPEWLSLNPFLTFSTFIIATTAGISMFKYLNSKSEVDLLHSLPIKRQKIFITRYITGIICYIVPYIINLIFCILFVTLAGGFELELIVYPFRALFYELLFFLSLYSFVAFATIISGNVFMSFYTSCIFIFAPILFTLIHFGLCDIYINFFAYSEEIFINVSTYTNPFFVMFNYYDNFNAYYRVLDIDAIQNLVGIIFQIVVMFTLAYFSFIHRKSENSSNPIALSVFKPVIKAVSVLCAGCYGGVLFMSILDSELFGFLIGAFIVGIIIHMFIEVLFDLDIRSLRKNLKHFGVCYGCIFIFIMSVFFDLTGYATRTVNSSDIASITYQGYELKDAESIETINNYIKRVVKTVDEKTYRTSNVSNHYLGETEITLKNGSSYKRDYYTNKEFFTDDEIIKIETTKEYIIQMNGYTLQTEDFINVKKEANEIYVNLTNGTKTIKYEDFYRAYNSALENIDLLTPEYLAENMPIANIMNIYYTANNERKFIKVNLYDIQKEALEILGLNKEMIDEPVYLSFTNNVDYSQYKLNFYNDGYGTFTIPEEYKELFSENMKYVYSYIYSAGGYTTQMKDLVVITDRYSEVIGYMSLEKFEEINKNIDKTIKIII